MRAIRRKGPEREQRASVPPTLPTASITTNSQAFRETADGRRGCGISNRKTNGGAVIELAYANPLMNRTPRHIFLPALLGAILAASAAAQQAKPIANWANLNQLVTGAEIRVTLADGKTLRGSMQRVTPESLAINATTSQETLSRQDIERVALKRPGHRGRNTLIGLAIGTGAGLAVGAGVDSQRRPGDWLPSFGKVVLSPVGAIIGTVVGAVLPTGGWREVYRAP